MSDREQHDALTEPAPDQADPAAVAAAYEATMADAPRTETDPHHAPSPDDAAEPTGSDGAEGDGVDGPVAEDVEDPRTPAELRAELAAAESQRDEYLDDVRRARAEFENFRKRTTREASAARDLGRADVASALLDVLDDLDRTLEAADGSTDETLAKGIHLVADKLRHVLDTQGLQRIDATGVAFDPEVHEAVQQVDAEEPTDQQVVHSVLRPGYRLGERTLRAAMVVVAG